MTVYVDRAYIPAKIGRLDSRWCHLLSDQLDPAELHEFAERLGLRRSWFQAGKRLGTNERWPAKDHYDVTEGKRWAAVRAGAVEIDQQQMVAIMRQKRDAWTVTGHRPVTSSEQATS